MPGSRDEGAASGRSITRAMIEEAPLAAARAFNEPRATWAGPRLRPTVGESSGLGWRGEPSALDTPVLPLPDWPCGVWRLPGESGFSGKLEALLTVQRAVP